LAEALGWELISADVIARRLTATDATVRRQIAERCGADVLDEKLELDRNRLRDLVFNDPLLKRGLEEILHPRIRSEWTERATVARRNHRNLIVEIPLLYETAAEDRFDRVVVVAAPREAQVERLTQHRGVPRMIAERMIDAQMPLPEKIRRAQIVLWNGGSLTAFDRQSTLLASLLEAPNA
jgi:dephospho-CoA kinase